ncbi:hypothetical protein ACHHYP_04900 [Achlya hypogyna]|uniref:Transmembrane protein n=1 Tax=Achlya hypogyna TaxID=1202772 RepID=A0A1V9YZT8_ACHHY|nr:hypothetical protein ACHHYP_04900 [Achlya hypogyna]
MDRVRSRVASTLPGVVSSTVIATAIASLGGCISLMLLSVLRITDIQPFVIDLSQVVEWIAVSIGLVLVVLSSFGASLLLLLSLPQRVPATSPAYGPSCIVRALRIESVLLFALYTVTSYAWHHLFVCYVSPAHLESVGALSLAQGLVWTCVVGFTSFHPLTFRVIADPVAALEASYGNVVASSLQYAVFTSIISGIFTQSASVHAIVSSSVLFVVLAVVSWTFAHLFARPGFSSPATKDLPLSHPWVSGHPLLPSPNADRQPYRLSLQTAQVEFLLARAAAMKGKDAPTYRALSLWEAYLASGDLVTAARDAPAALFASEATWSKTFQEATATLDLLAEQLATVDAWMHTTPAPTPSLPAKLKTWAMLVRTLASGEVSPLALLASPPAGLPQWQRLAFDLLLSYLLLSFKSVLNVVEALGAVVVASYAKDKQGHVQLSVAAILTSLLGLRLVLDKFQKAKEPAVHQLTTALDATIRRIATTYAKQQADVLQYLSSTHVKELRERGLLTA